MDLISWLRYPYLLLGHSVSPSPSNWEFQVPFPFPKDYNQVICAEVTAGCMSLRMETLLLPRDPGRVETPLCRLSSDPENLIATGSNPSSPLQPSRVRSPLQPQFAHFLKWNSSSRPSRVLSSQRLSRVKLYPHGKVHLYSLQLPGSGQMIQCAPGRDQPLPTFPGNISPH